MKAFFAMILTSVVAATALAGQTITCRQINKNGSVTKNGVEVQVTMTTKKSGTATVNGFNDDRYSNQVVNGLNQGTAIDGSKYTTIFLVPQEDDGMLDIQLQFNAIVIGKNFSKIKATYVIGSDDANPETGFAFGYDMICNGQVK